MSELVTTSNIPTLTALEAEAITKHIRNRSKSLQIELFMFREMKGHISMGWPNFGEFCSQKLEIPASTAYLWCDQVNVALAIVGKNSKDLLDMVKSKHVEQVDAHSNIGMENLAPEIKLLPSKTSIELAKLSDHPEDISQVWKELEAIRGYSARTETQYHTELQRRVRAILEMRKQMDTPAIPAPDETEEETGHGEPEEDDTMELTFQSDEEEQIDMEDEDEEENDAIHYNSIPEELPDPHFVELGYLDPYVDNHLTFQLAQDCIRVSEIDEGDYCFYIVAYTHRDQKVSIAIDMDDLPGELMETIHRKWERLRKQHGTADVRKKTFVTWKETED